jgi:hypothetical protein
MRGRHIVCRVTFAPLMDLLATNNNLILLLRETFL